MPGIDLENLPIRFSLVHAPRDAGMDPSKSFPYISKFSRFVSCPISVGIEPVNNVLDQRSSFAPVNLPIRDEMVPEKEFVLRLIFSSFTIS